MGIVNGDLLERLLDVTHRDQVEGDVDSARPVDNYVYKLVDRPLVERIDNAGVHRAATRPDLIGNRGELIRGSARQEDPGPFARQPGAVTTSRMRPSRLGPFIERNWSPG